MNTTKSYVPRFLTAVVLMTACLQPVVIGQSGRRLEYSAGKKIVDQLRADDTEVVLDLKSTSPLIVGPPAGQTWLDFRTQLSDVVALVQAEKVEPFLVPGGDMVRTRITFRVTEPLKIPDSSEIQSLELLVPGGTVEIAGKKVHAIVTWARAVKREGKYLAFAGCQRTVKCGH